MEEDLKKILKKIKDYLQKKKWKMTSKNGRRPQKMEDDLKK